MNDQQGLKESESCNIVGWIIIALGVIGGLVFIFAFGRVEVVTSYYSTEKEWSGTMVAVGFGMMLNGFFGGYLFQKIASILRYHEQKKHLD